MAIKKVKTIKVSEAGSFELWNLLAYIKGRKKGLVAIIGTALALLITDSELAALFSGLLFEGLISIAEFYFSKVEIK